MLPLSSSLDIIIPKSWPKNIKSRVLHVISLAHYAITYARGWAENSINARVRLQAKLNTALEEIAKLRAGISVWETPPSSLQVRRFLGQNIARTGRSPKYIICDKGPQFWNDGFKGCCRRKRIYPRFGAVGRHGSIAIVERFILTLKNSYTRLTLVPPGKNAFRRELQFFVRWYNEYRAHTALGGKTPHEAYYRLLGANKILRFEPRSRWPVRSRCASPRAAIHGKLGTRLVLHVRGLAGRRHLPIVKLRIAT